MARLPIQGEDSGTWGDILNEFLQVGHHTDGTNIGGIVEIAKSSDYTLVAADNGKRLVATTSITFTVPDVGTLGNGFKVEIINDSGGTVTIDGPGSTNVSLSNGDIGYILEVNSKQLVIKGPSTNISYVIPPGILIGGVAIGDVGTGFYNGYTLSWGDEFNAFDLVHAGNPKGRFFTTRAYGPGPRGTVGASSWLATQYDTDPYHMGNNDSNRGVAVGFNNMSLSNSVINLQARDATLEEQAHMDLVRNEVTSMLHTAGSCIYYISTDPIIVEARIKYSAKAGNPAGWHTDFWTLSTGPIYSPDVGNDEWDFETNSQKGQFKHIIWTNGSYVDTVVTDNIDIFDNNFHKLTYILRNGSTCLLYIDDVLVGTRTADANSKNRPQCILFTSHIFNGAFAGETYNASAWNADPDGATMSIDWVRVWRTTGTLHLKPLVVIDDLNVSYTGIGSLVLPSATALWGDASVTEYVQIIPHEAGDPGVSTTSSIMQFPSTVTYNSGTRTVSVDFSAGIWNTGRLHGVVYAYKTNGSISEPARFTINRGPLITTTNITANINQPYSRDLYIDCVCGSLLPKVITVTNLPAGLNFSTSTGLLTGTPTASGTFTIQVVNSVGQSSIKDIVFTAGITPPAYASWTGPGWFDSSDNTKVTFNGSQVTGMINKRSGGGNLMASGNIANLTLISGAQNGRDIVRVVRDISGPTTPPRFFADPTNSNLSTMFQGDDKAYTVITVYKPTDANTGYIWSASDTVDSTDSQQIALIRRNDTASSVRRMLSTSTPNDASWGSGQASGTVRVVAVKHTGTTISVWDNSTTKVVDALSQNTTTFNTELVFRMFVSETNWSSDPLIAGTQCSLDFCEILIESSAKSDADIVQAIQDLATKWGITLS